MAFMYEGDGIEPKNRIALTVERDHLTGHVSDELHGLRQRKAA